MKRKVLLSVAAAMVLVGANIKADNLASPGGSTAGWYDGTGNPNGGFTVTNTGGIELGLRAKLRQSPSVIEPTGNLYVVPTGLQSPDSGTHAAWNYEYSVDLGTSGFTLANTTTALTVTDTEGDTFTVSDIFHAPFSADSALVSTGGAVSHQTLATVFSTEIGAQNSENPIFGNFPLKFSSVNGPYTYDPNKADTYTFTLDTYANAGGGLLAEDMINVQTVAPLTPAGGAPLPNTVVAGMACLGIVGVGRYMKRKPVVA
jgi:hypothetical protein